MRILFADKVPDWFPARLREAGVEVKVDPSLDGDTLTQAIASFDPEVIVVRSTKVQAAQLEAARSLKVVLRAGAGVNTIDIAGATARKIAVTNCPGTNSAAVAELAVGLLIDLDRRISENVIALRAGRWDKKGFSKARGLNTRTLGLLGMGNIGARVGRAAQALGMKVVYWDPFIPAERGAELGAVKMETPEEVAAAADAVSIHLAEVPATRGLVGEKFFAAMKKGAYLINTSRAGIVAKEPMLAAIAEKNIRVALDVFWNEPAADSVVFDDASMNHPNIVGTHHIGASTDEAQDAVSIEAARIIDVFRTTGQVPNQVNPF